MVVGPVEATLRATRSGAGAALATLPAGTRLEWLSDPDFPRPGPIQVRAPSGQVGWIDARSLTTLAGFERLQPLTPDDYVQTRRLETRVKQVIDQLEPLQPRLAALQREILAGAPSVADSMAAIDQQRNIKVETDPTAVRWYGGLALAREKAGDDAGVIAPAQAALAADPSAAAGYLRLAFAQYRLGRLDEIRWMADVVPLLAPRNPDSWVLVGLIEGRDGHRDAAVAALSHGLQLGGNTPAIRRRYERLVDQTRDDRVGAALLAALAKG
jgi:cytochrome c-type biogenesis protein CcmH/NrfG